MWLIKLIAVLCVVYVGVVAVMYFAQTSLLFPARLAATGETLPATATRLEIETPDGERLQGTRIPPAREGTEEPLVLLGFSGNAWNADTMAVYLHGLFPDAEIVTIHYRGYGPSTGRPSAAALLADAPVIYDHIVETLQAEQVVAVGFSIGSGVVAHLASQRPLAGLILVTPFDSLEALVREHYRWAPVGWLLRHHMEPAEALNGLTIPIAVLGAEYDTIVPPRRTDALRRAVPDPVLDRTIAGADHNDLYGQRDFRAAMIEALARIRSMSE